MTSVVGTSVTVIPSSLLVFLLPRRPRFTLHSPRLLFFFEAFTAKLHSHRQTESRETLCQCLWLSWQSHKCPKGNTRAFCNPGRHYCNCSNKSNVYYKLFYNCPAVSLSAGRGGSPEDIPYHSVFQSAVTEARLWLHQARADGHKALVMGTPETPWALLSVVVLLQ